MTLTESAKQDLLKSGLNRATIHTMGAYSVTEDHVDWLKENNIRYKYPEGLLHELTDFYALPYPQGGMRIKLLNTIVVDGDERKYMQPTGKDCELYYLPEDELKFPKTKKPIVFTEGEKKTAKLAQELGEDYLCIGSSGVSTWLTDEWRKINLKDREVYIAFDRDTERNPLVEEQALALFLYLWKREAVPYFLNFDGEKVDDWLCELDQPKKAVLDAVSNSRGNNDFYTFGKKINKRYLAKKLVQYGYEKSDASILWKEVPWQKKSGIGINPLKKLIERERIASDREKLKKQGKNWIEINEDGKRKVVTGKLAKTMMEKYKQAIKYHQGSFWTYNEKEGVWQEESEGGKRVKAKIQEVLGEELAKKSIVEDVFFQMQNYAVPDKLDFEFESEEGFLNLKNGVLSLKTMQLMNHDKIFNFTSRINANYDPKAKAPKWEKLLNDTELNKETINRLQEWFGYCLIRDTRLQKALFLVGNAGTGKSTIVETLGELLKDYSSSIDPSRMFERFVTSQIRNKLVNICTDADTTAYLDDKIKKIISGELVFGESKGKDGYTFRPFVRLIFSANDFVATKDKSEGFFRRFDVIRIDKVCAEINRDKTLKEDIWRDEMDGVFIWALEGLKRLMANDFVMTESKEMSLNLEDYKEEVNPLYQFLKVSCKTSPEHKTCIKLLYKSYENWCKMTGHIPLSSSKMGREIRKIYPYVSTIREGGGERNNIYPYLETLHHFSFNGEKYECEEVTDSEFSCTMTDKEKTKAEKKNKSGIKPVDQKKNEEEERKAEEKREKKETELREKETRRTGVELINGRYVPVDIPNQPKDVEETETGEWNLGEHQVGHWEDNRGQ